MSTITATIAMIMTMPNRAVTTGTGQRESSRNSRASP